MRSLFFLSLLIVTAAPVASAEPMEFEAAASALVGDSDGDFFGDVVGAQPPPALLTAGVEIPSIGLGRLVFIFPTADPGLPAVVESARVELSVPADDAELETRFWSSTPVAGDTLVVDPLDFQFGTPIFDALTLPGTGAAETLVFDVTEGFRRARDNDQNFNFKAGLVDEDPDGVGERRGRAIYSHTAAPALRPRLIVEFLAPVGELTGEFESPVPLPVGDVLFSDDGSTAWMVGASETATSAIYQMPVSRDASDRVTAFGTPAEVLARGYIDAGLQFAPGTDTLFYTFLNDDNELSVGQRRADGALKESVLADFLAEYGGLAFIPSGPHAGDLLASYYDTGEIVHFDVTPDGDGFFTVTEVDVAGDTGANQNEGDIDFLRSGPFAGWLVIARYGSGRVELREVDFAGPSVSDEPTLFFDQAGTPWGVAIDPLTHETWITDFDADEGQTALWRVPEPGAGVGGGVALLAIGWLRKRSKRTAPA